MKLTKRTLLAVSLATAGIGAGLWAFGRPWWRPLSIQRLGEQTLDQVLADLGPRLDGEWAALHRANQLPYPPAELALVATKLERQLEVWSRAAQGPFKRLASFPILAASGQAGPKLREGDRQVPEGQYRILSFNPNSRFHLSMELDYPNAFDRAQAAAEGRTQLGGEIYLHGGAASIGCLAMGDPVIEKLFILVARAGRDQTRVLILPQEPSGAGWPLPPTAPPWLQELYRQLWDALRQVRG